MPRSLKIAFLHYHLKPGGVTTVIRHQAEAVRDTCETLVFCGEVPGKPFPAETIPIEGLAYDAPGQKQPNPSGVAGSILEALRSRWPQGCDILHVHNPTLAKNRQLLDVLSILQEKGVRLFLQVHDFAEDGRPHVFTPRPYPAGCHWAAINSRDYRALIRSGLRPEGLSLLPNAVTPIQTPATPISRQGFALYPVRGIRRKNTGEAFLLTLLSAKAKPIRITLPPNSPEDRHSHEAWRRFVTTHALRVRLDTGLHERFARQAAGADFFITTSITEGFGFSFLEPWTIGKPLSGRRLPEICSDFEKKGLVFDSLYDRIRIPLSWIDAARFFKRFKKCVAAAAAAFSHPIPETKIDNGFRNMTQGAVVDFGLLDEGFQEEILLAVLSDPEKARFLLASNPNLETCIHPNPTLQVIRSNQDAVKIHYNKDRYRKRLLDAYARVMETPVSHHVNKTSLLEDYFDLNAFSLLKWGHDPR